jgi:7-keto-8-aminopelargonate synthetase-like enzyme
MRFSHFRGPISIAPANTHHGDVSEIRERLAAEKPVISVAEHRLRISLSIFNDLDDTERLVNVLS